MVDHVGYRLPEGVLEAKQEHVTKHDCVFIKISPTFINIKSKTFRGKDAIKQLFLKYFLKCVVLLSRPSSDNTAKAMLILTNKKHQIKNQIFIIRGITPKRVTSGGAHLRGLAPELHSSEETSQRWRAVGDTVPLRERALSN